MLRRRVLSIGIGMIVASHAMPVLAQSNPDLPRIMVEPLVGTLHELRCNGDAQMVASVGEDGTLLVDTGYPATAEAVQSALAGIGASPVRIIINTHGDPDHVGGNSVLGTDGLIFGHPAVRLQMGAYYALPLVESPGLPTVTVESETIIHFNGERIRVLPIPGGHTAGDLIVHFTGSGVAAVGDIVLTGTFPDAAPERGGDAQRLAAVLRHLQDELPPETLVVPGHGASFNASELHRYIAMIEGTTAAVREEYASGRSLEEIIASQPLVRWARWERADIGLSYADWITQIWTSLEGNRRLSICAPVTQALMDGGIQEAARTYRRLAAEEAELWRFDEGELNVLGYQLLNRGMVDEAIAILSLNVEAYPQAFNTHDSLGEAYMTAGERERAIASCRRSLELNPENANAVRMLKRLEGN